MAIPKRPLIFVASLAVAGVAIYLKNRADQRRDEQRREKHREQRKAERETGKDDVVVDNVRVDDAKVSNPHAGNTGAAKELALFLAGDAWHDEIGWQALWEREHIEDAAGWLKTKGSEVLSIERKKLIEHPALLAGCRRRWIVVCRYAAIDVADAAVLWNAAEGA
jgi:hypothetical protein